ncbi:Bifunctional purine biosynthesis protein PurH [uncultured archaeon]|nr:Bifunctional purine biosynthesis protein PurH [uncultured archaeon]
MKIKTALISVSDKTGLVDFAKELAENGVKIISSGGTFKALRDAGIGCTSVEDVTGFPEMLDGRVKTLHPKIHAGILAKRNISHLGQLKKHNIETIDLVVVNLYPFQQAASKEGAKLEEIIENIDIGGPSLIRGAAKNHEFVGVIVEPRQYAKVLEELRKNGFGLSEKLRRELMVEALQHTAFYDAMISSCLAEKFGTAKFPEKFSIGFEKFSEPRYGENPHQNAMVYKGPLANSGIISAKQLNGKELSYNNYLDADAALSIAAEFSEPCAAIVKHNNPCGVATAKNISDAFSGAYDCDSLSAFGGVICINRKCDLETAKKITSFFNEVIIAPSYEGNALEELKKKTNLRVLELKQLENAGTWENGISFRQIEGGLLAQEKDTIKNSEWQNPDGIKAGQKDIEDLQFAWRIVKNVKSNAIVIARGKATIGIGMGLTSRVDSVELALKKAGEKAKGGVLASDAYFPFSDSIKLCAKAGISAIVEPGGSIKDPEVIEEAKKQGIALYFTGERHFRH